MGTATLASLLPVPVVIVLSGAIAAPLVARLWRPGPLLLACVSLAGATGVLCLLAPRVFAGAVVRQYLGNWLPVHGAVLGIAFAADPFGLTFALAAAALGTLLIVYAMSELGPRLGARELGTYACLVQLLLAALMGAALTEDLFNLFVWFEVASLASYGLTAFFLERPLALEAAFKVLVLTTIAGFFIFLGNGLLYANHGAFDYTQLHVTIQAHPHRSDLVALALLLAGFAVKAGLAPFHAWLPDAQTAVCGSVAALFAALMLGLGVVGLGRVCLQVYTPGDRGHVLGLLMGFGLASAVPAALLALAQDDLKRLLGYVAVAQTGVLVVALATATPTGVGAALYDLLTEALALGLVFLCAGAVLTTSGVTSLAQMRAATAGSPLLAGAFAVGVAGLAGLPPFGGYASLSLVHDALQPGHRVVLGLVLLAQGLADAALLRAAYLGFARRGTRSRSQRAPLGAGMKAALLALAAGLLALGLVPHLIAAHLGAGAAAALLHPDVSGSALRDGLTTLRLPRVGLDYGSPEQLLLAFGTFLLGGALAACYLRVAEPAPVRWLRSLHSGSVNDYAAYVVVGLLVAVAVLTA